MKSYLKFLSRNKLYTAIEAVGLAVSLAFLILIGTSIRDQVRIPSQIPKKYNLHLLGMGRGDIEYRQLEKLSTLPEIRSAAMFAARSFTVQAGEEKWEVPGLVAHPLLLDYVPQKVIAGDLALFKEGSGVVITEPAARKMFPGQDPLSKDLGICYRSFSMNGWQETVSREPIVAIVADPALSFLDDFDVLVSCFSSLPEVAEMRNSNLEEQGYGTTVNVLVDLVPNCDKENLADKFKGGFMHFYVPDINERTIVIPARDIFFQEDPVHGLRQGKRLYLNVLIALGLLLLACAILNYVNLNLAISGNRAKEMATRQLVGASRASIVMKGVCESLVFTTVCFLLAILLADWLAPLLNSIKPAGLAVPFRVSWDGESLLLWAGMVLLLGVLAGLSPALFLASYRPLDIVTGKVRRKRKMGFNRACIVLQAVLSFVFIAMSLTLEAQLRYTLHLDLGITPVDNLYCFYPGQVGTSQALLQQLEASPRVKTIGRGYGYPTLIGGISSGPNQASYCTIQCDSSAFRLLGFRVKEQWAPSLPGTFWLTEEARDFVGITESSPDLSLLWGRYPNPTVTAVGGVIENFRRYPVNGVDQLRQYNGFTKELLCAVMINKSEILPYIWIQTDVDHAAFDRWFKEVAANSYRQSSGIADLLSRKNVLCGYFEDIIARDHKDLQRFVRVVELFGLITILISMLGLMAISTWFASSNAKGIAIRKVFGGTMDSELWRTVRSYMVMTGIATIIGLPVAVVLIRRFLEDYPERIDSYTSILSVTVLLTLIIAFSSVIWQTLKAAKTNPAIELKKE